MEQFGKLKILLTSGIYKPDVGGPATFIPKLASYLQEKDIEVEVVTLRNKNTVLPLENWNVNSTERYKNKLFRFFKTTKLIGRAAKSSNVIFSNGLFIETAVVNKFNKKFIVAKIVGDPVWEKSRNLNYKKNSDLFGLQKIKLGILRKIYNQAFGSFDLIICPSKELCDIVLSWNIGVRVQYVPNGIETRPLIEVQEKKYDLVTVCRLVPWKNVDKLIQICSKTNLSLAIIGDGPLKKDLKLASSKITSKVFFLGTLDDIEIEKVLRESKVFCLYSDYEGLSFALLHAMSTGIPVCVSDIPGNNQVVINEEVGLKLTGNQNIDAALIKALINDENRRRKIAMQARVHIDQNFNLEKIFEEYWKILFRS
jgi:glycosyltransferase involved in cell wall biosynthesis